LIIKDLNDPIPYLYAKLVKIMLTGLFADKPIYRKFLILGGILILSTIIFSMVGGLLTEFIFGVNILSDPGAATNLKDPNVIASMKLLQVVTTGIGMFLVPSFLAGILFHASPVKYLSLRSAVSPLVLLSTVLIMFAAVPLINLMMAYNQHLHLPEFLSSVEVWMKESEAQAMKITDAFLTMNSANDMLLNLLVIAVVPAIGEELLFRGVLQRLFQELTRNVHLTVFLTAAIFSAIHMQFYGFLPRMFLGVLFGYMLVWTGNIWVPVLAHFINNGAAVFFAWLAGIKQMPFNQDTIGAEASDLPFALASAVAVIGFMLLIKKTAAHRSSYNLHDSDQ